MSPRPRFVFTGFRYSTDAICDLNVPVPLPENLHEHNIHWLQLGVDICRQAPFAPSHFQHRMLGGSESQDEIRKCESRAS